MSKDYLPRVLPVTSEMPDTGTLFDESAIDFGRIRHVVVKPNWVQESHEYEPDVWKPVITDPELVLSVTRALASRLCAGSVISICDAPHTYASFGAITARGDFARRLAVLRNEYPHVGIELLDLRREVWRRVEEVVVERIPNQPDPRGYARLDLSVHSLFYRHAGEGRYYGADYDSRVVNEHHRGEVHEYLVAGTAIACDLFVNLPKLKTHKKTGITCCLKNLVGINGDKNWLPHHTEGGPGGGGDEFPAEGAAQRVERAVKKIGRRVALAVPLLGSWMYRRMRTAGKAVLGDSESTIRNGNWHGNDTTWRMALDLNRALLYGNLDGSWRDEGQPKQYFAIVDGVIGGEGNGPICPDAVESRVLVAGDNPAEVDAVCAQVMGFNPNELPIVRHAFDKHRWPIVEGSLSALRVRDDRAGRVLPLAAVEPCVADGFKPHFGWQRLNARREVSRGS